MSSLTCNWKGHRSSRKFSHPIYSPWWAWCWSELLSGLKILNICLASYSDVANKSKCRPWIWGILNHRPLLGVLSSFRKLTESQDTESSLSCITRGRGTWMNQDHMLQWCGSSPGHHLLKFCPWTSSMSIAQELVIKAYSWVWAQINESQPWEWTPASVLSKAPQVRLIQLKLAN